MDKVVEVAKVLSRASGPIVMGSEASRGVIIKGVEEALVEVGV